MLTILSKDLALEKVISLIYFKRSNLKYSELEFWTNFCPYYRFDLYGECPMVKTTHTKGLDNSLKILQVQQHIPGCMRPAVTPFPMC